jgi:hypothetical protein
MSVVTRKGRNEAEQLAKPQGEASLTTLIDRATAEFAVSADDAAKSRGHHQRSLS